MPLALLSSIGFLAYCSYAICRTPLLPLFARELGATAPQVGFVVAASTLTGVVIKLPAGAWSDVLGRRPLLIAGTLVFALMPFSYLLVSSLGLLIAFRFVHGAATAITGPVASAGLSDLAPNHRRATWLSTYSVCQSAGQALGPLLAGWLIAGGHYRAAFVSAGVIALITPLLAARWPGERAPLIGASLSLTRQFTGGIRDVSREPQILLASATHAGFFVLSGMLTAFLPLFAIDAIGLNAAEVGWLFAAQTITLLVMRPIIGMASDRVGRRGVIASGLLTCAAAVVTMTFATTRSELYMAVLAYALGTAFTTAATSAYITDVAPRARYGAAHGVFGTIYDVGDAAGPIVGGLLVGLWGYETTFQAAALGTAIIAIVFYRMSRRS